MQSFKARHNIKQLLISGESGDVNEETVQALIQGYSLENVWNEDETACFFRALPDKTLAEAERQCKGGKKAKNQLTLAFFVNAAGEKELPIVIGKAASPRCFKGMKNKKPYYHNKKAWMDSTIMIDILSNFNKKLAQQQQNILLFLDNVSSHTPELSEMFSHINVIFLPKNTTSRLQPLDAGIIKNFKVHYRKKLITHALAQIGSTSATATEIAKQVDVLHAIRWIKQAWDQVEVSTIQHCFNHCGFSYISVPTGDPFADLDKDESLKQMVKQLDTEMSATE